MTSSALEPPERNRDVDALLVIGSIRSLGSFPELPPFPRVVRSLRSFDSLVGSPVDRKRVKGAGAAYEDPLRIWDLFGHFKQLPAVHRDIDAAWIVAAE